MFTFWLDMVIYHHFKVEVVRDGHVKSRCKHDTRAVTNKSTYTNCTLSVYEISSHNFRMHKKETKLKFNDPYILGMQCVYSIWCCEPWTQWKMTWLFRMRLRFQCSGHSTHISMRRAGATCTVRRMIGLSCRNSMW